MKKLFTLIAATMMAATSMFAGTTVGATDNTSTWWTAFSDYYTLVDGQTATVTFTNYSSKANNWNNWLVVLTNVERDATGYAEYFVLRCDNYGWGANYNDGTLTSNYNWDTFLEDMDGSKVVMTVSRDGNKITVHADMTTTTDATYFENYEVEIADLPETIGFFLTTELGHLEDLTVDVANSIKAVPEVAESNNAAVYNLAGQRVSDNYRGVVVKNGKKFINK